MSRFKSFINGLVIGLLLIATLNSLSYFARSTNWSSLVNRDRHGQALGFPFEIWRYGTTYADGGMLDSRAISLNVATAFAIGILIGLFSLANSAWLTGFTQSMIEDEKRQLKEAGMQFSIRGLFLMTGASAVIAGLVRASMGARPEILWVIYILGPSFLIALAMIPRGLTWQIRIVLLTPSTLILIGFAMYVGQLLGLDLEKVMFGIFVCWVPQTVIAAGCLTLGLALRYNQNN